MKTNVYVDCFNLYYGCLKDTPLKWLNLAELVRCELPGTEIERLRCFLAQVKARPGDLNQPMRQLTYVRALRTLPGISIHWGTYLESQIWMPVAYPPPSFIEVLKSEEKGSDVNLATYLVLDASRGECDHAVVITNDSDLCEPIRVVRDEFKIPVTVLHPMRHPEPGEEPTRKPSMELRKVSTTSKAISRACLVSAQFAPVLKDAVGTITKPPSW